MNVVIVSEIIIFLNYILIAWVKGSKQFVKAYIEISRVYEIMQDSAIPKT